MKEIESNQRNLNQRNIIAPLTGSLKISTNQPEDEINKISTKQPEHYLDPNVVGQAKSDYLRGLGIWFKTDLSVGGGWKGIR